MSEELNEAIAWLTEHIDMREHVRSEPVHYLRKHLDAITAARARIAELERENAENWKMWDIQRSDYFKQRRELEAQHLATQRALVDCRNSRTFMELQATEKKHAAVIEAARADVAQAGGKEARS